MDIVPPSQTVGTLEEWALNCEDDCFDRLKLISCSELFHQTFFLAGIPSNFFFDKPPFDQKILFLRC
jgi:hypothetical protein